MPEINVLPKRILFLMWPFKGESCYPQIEGDLAEEFQLLVKANGIESARRWYRREIVRNLFSLACRWVTIPVVLLPLLCLVSTFVLPRLVHLERLHPAVAAIAPQTYWPTTRSYVIFLNLISFFLNLSLVTLLGLLLGTVTGLILSGHGRLARVAFGFYYLAVVGLRASVGFDPYYMGSLTLIWTLIFIWMGIIWTEGKHKVHKAA